MTTPAPAPHPRPRPFPPPPTRRGANWLLILVTVLALGAIVAFAFLNGAIDRGKGWGAVAASPMGVLAAVALGWLIVFAIARVNGRARTGAGKVQIAFWVTALALLGEVAVFSTKMSGTFMRGAMLSAVTDSERTGLVVDSSGIHHPLFGFSLPPPGRDFVPDPVAQKRMDSLTRGERGLVAWVLHSASTGGVVIVQVTKGARMDELTFRAFAHGVHRTAARGKGTKVLVDSVTWTAGTGEYLYAAQAANGAYVQVRCVPHTTHGTGLIVCITTGSADRRTLDFVRNGLAFAGP